VSTTIGRPGWVAPRPTSCCGTSRARSPGTLPGRRGLRSDVRASRRVLELPPSELAAQAAGAFALADGRSGEVAVRAFNPELERDGYATSGSVLEVNTGDSPFLFDSLSEELDARGLRVRGVIHPVIGTRRGADGRVLEVLDARDAERRESVMHFEVDRRLGEAELADLADAARAILGTCGSPSATSGGCATPSAGWCSSPRRPPPGTGARRSTRPSPSCGGCCRTTSCSSGTRVRARRRGGGATLAVVEGSGLGILSKPGWSTYDTAVDLGAVEPACGHGSPAASCSSTRRRTAPRPCTGGSGWTRSRSAGSRRTARPPARCGCSACSPRRRTRLPPARPRAAPQAGQDPRAEDLFEGSHDYKAVVSIFDSFRRPSCSPPRPTSSGGR